jgi:general nucleoside transport system permease protein
MKASPIAAARRSRQSTNRANLLRYAIVAVMIMLLIAVTVLVGRGSDPAGVIVASFLATMLAVSTPLALGALCGIFCERAGVVNIAIEGLMLAAAFFGFTAATFAKAAGLANLPSLLTGVLAAVLVSMLFSLLHAVLSITFKINQVISGTVINMFAIGLTGFLQQQIVFRGLHLSSAGVLPTLRIPILADLPVFGPIFRQQPIAISALILVAVTHLVLFQTKWGQHMIAVGEHPRAADTVGISVKRVRYTNVLIGGAIAGLAGAYFTLESVPSFQPLMTNGRGFIALAAVIFGNWMPVGAWVATLLFGAAQALQINLQYYSSSLPESLSFLKTAQFVGMLPYILTVLAVTGIMGRSTPPAADGQPYEG